MTILPNKEVIHHEHIKTTSPVVIGVEFFKRRLSKTGREKPNAIASSRDTNTCTGTHTRTHIGFATDAHLIPTLGRNNLCLVLYG